MGLNSIRLAWRITLLENQTWISPVIDVRGFTLYGVQFFNRTGAPAAITAKVEMSDTQDFYPDNPIFPAYQAFIANSGSIGGQYTQPAPLLGDFLRLKVYSGSTSGTYGVDIHLMVSP
jgi:hypothetical protein